MGASYKIHYSLIKDWNQSLVMTSHNILVMTVDRYLFFYVKKSYMYNITLPVLRVLNLHEITGIPSTDAKGLFSFSICSSFHDYKNIAVNYIKLVHFKLNFIQVDRDSDRVKFTTTGSHLLIFLFYLKKMRNLFKK